MTAFQSQLCDKLVEFYEGDPWVTDNFKEKVLVLSSDSAITSVAGYHHNVAQIVAHMTAWRNFVTRKMNGDTTHNITLNTPEDWPLVGSWEQVKEDFRKSQVALLDAIKHFERWSDIVPLRTYRFDYLVDGIIKHDYYHYGQIGSLIAALKG